MLSNDLHILYSDKLEVSKIIPKLKNEEHMKETFTLLLTNGASHTVTVFISQDTTPADIQEDIASFLNPFKIAYLDKLVYSDDRDGTEKQFKDFTEYNDENTALLTFICDCNLI